MNESKPSHLADSDLPISAAHLHLYGRFWDVLSVLIFSFAAIAVLTAHANELTWREWAVAGLSVAQGALYLICIRGGGWPISNKNLTIYFVGGVCMWVLACWLNPFTWWLGFTYFGQMFGLLPLRGVVFGTAVVTVLIALIISNWNLKQIPLGAAFGFSFQWLGGMAVFLFIYGIIRTSSQRAELITKLESAQRELEAARQRDAELATLRERERLARDLHDSLGHSLVTLSVQLEAIQRLYKVDAEKASAQVDELKDITRASMDDLRRSLAGLRTPGLGERQLRDALQSLSVDVAQRAHLAIACQIDDAADQLSPAQAETIWRVAQESLTNIERHAAARNVDLRLGIEAQFATLVIQDDGCGLPPNPEDTPGHYGLRGMRERVEGLGGTLTLSGNGGGSRVDVKLPLL